MKRQHSPKHLDFIRSLPCVICKDTTATEAAHIRFADRTVDKRQTGKGEKPDDCWTVPLCSGCHRAQHEFGEIDFWGADPPPYDPIRIALALWRVSGDYAAGCRIVEMQ